LAPGTGPHYLEETHEDSYALPRGMLLMMMMMTLMTFDKQSSRRRIEVEYYYYYICNRGVKIPRFNLWVCWYEQ